MSGLSSIYTRLPEDIRNSLESLPEEILDRMEEIRLQVGQPSRVRSGGREIVLKTKSDKISRENIDIVLNNLLDYSIYAYEEDLAKGFITIEGGHRVGVCGKVVSEDNNIKLIKDISSLNIRRSKEIIGVASNVIDQIYDKENGLHNTIIVSPPKCGKTTLLRDIVRVLSYMGERIGVCDERSEIAGMYAGCPSYDIGPRTDVLDGCDKAEGMLMMIRSMSPDIIVTDEIGKAADAAAIESAVCSGVRILTTIHGSNYDDLINSRIGYLIEQGLFRRIIFLCNVPSTGTIREVRHV